MPNAHRITRSKHYVLAGSFSAFTLTELLVITAILGILSALLLTAVSQGKARALRIQCAGNEHQLGVGLQVLLSNNHGYPLFIANEYSEYPKNHRTWMDQLERDGLGVSQPETNFFEKGVWRCPSARWAGKFTGSTPGLVDTSYGYNAYGLIIPGGNKNIALGLGHSGNKVPVGESEVVNPSDMMAIGDSFSGSIEFSRGNLYYLEKIGMASSRHQRKANVLFCDGHVDSPTLIYLFEDTSDIALSRWNRDNQPHRERLLK
jgi:prepilin-type processing-associated H-X9-DG protein